MDLQIDTWSDKKISIVDAVIELVSDIGFPGTTTAKIAKLSKVGEGTIYRYFKNKDELIDITAIYVSSRISAPVLKNYRPTTTIQTQYSQYCHDFLQTGIAKPKLHKFLEQYINSPTGVKYRREMLRELAVNPEAQPLLYPLNRILSQAKEQRVIRDLPLHILISLTLGPISFILRDISSGLFEPTENMTTELIKSCWRAISR